MAIGLVHVRSWQVTYRGSFPQEFLDRLDPVQRGDRWRQFLEQGPGDSESVLVADVGRSVVGFANLGPSRDEHANGVGELRAIYLLPEYWGKGVGRDLMTAVLGTLADLGFEQATLWVLDRNTRARRFYEAAGWEADGATKCDRSQGFPIAEVRYRHRLR